METDLKQCPECAEEVKAAALKCRYCDFRFDTTHPVTPAAARRRYPRWTWVATAAFLAVAIGGGVYLGSASSPARASAEAYAKCKTQLTPTITAIRDLNSHLDVGITAAEYAKAVGDTKAVFDRLADEPIAPRCEKVVASLDRAMTWYGNTASEWNACIESDSCTPEPQPSWEAAAGHVGAALRLLDELGPHQSGPSRAQLPSEQDAEAKAEARNLVSQVESCAADYAGDYTNCDSSRLSNTGLAIGPGEGQVETVQTSPTGYTVAATSHSGNTFTITKQPSGVTTRTCTSGAQAGCGAGQAW
jgi:type IV pilus assembly protein PilA